jgi:hypothetical protein
MKLTPITNAGLAFAYITFIVFAVQTFAPGPDTPDKFPLTPIAVLSLFTLSAAVMGFLFLYEPLRLFMEGQKEKALPFFLKTLGTFAVFVFALFFALFFVK